MIPAIDQICGQQTQPGKKCPAFVHDPGFKINLIALSDLTPAAVCGLR